MTSRRFRRDKGVPMPHNAVPILALAVALATPVGAQTPLRGDRPFNGEFVTMHEGFENFPLNEQFMSGGFLAPPESFTGPLGFEWGLNRLTGQTAAGEWARVIDLTGAPLGGSNGVTNASRVMRIQTVTPQQPNGFFAGAALRWSGLLSPESAEPVRVSSEVFITDAGNTNFFEISSFPTGIVVARTLWGGTCSDDSDAGYCSNLGLPTGPIPGIQTLIVNFDFAYGPYIFRPARFCFDARDNVIEGCVPPPGGAVGDQVPLPIGIWSEFAYEVAADGRYTLLLNRLDGVGAVAINGDSYTAFGELETGFIDRVAFSSSYEAAESELYVDNVRASGSLYVPPNAPPAACPLVDDLDWMDTGVAGVQAGEWQFAGFNSHIVAEESLERGVVLSHRNRLIDGRFRREFWRNLSQTDLESRDLIVSFDVSTDAPTVRAFALFDGDDLAARVTIGVWPFETFENQYDPSVLVQINPDYEPIDPSFESPDANAPVIGVDVADTGFDWINDEQFRRVEMRLSNNGSLRVSIDGQRVYAGPGGFAAGVDLLVFESESNSYGSGTKLYLDALTVDCDAPSCATDFDLDDETTFNDLNAVLANFGASALNGFHPGDTNADGVVDFTDLNAVLAAFGTSCQ